MAPPTFEADEAAAAFIHEHGGRFFVWLSQAGIEHEATKPPGQRIAFTDYSAERFTLSVDREIEEPHLWRLVYHRFPRPHVRALWNGAAFSPSGSRAPSWEGEKPWQ